jgi:DNA-3-methyladenine glycosylase II
MNKTFVTLCPTMAKLHARFGDCPIPSDRGYSAYEALFRAIVFQQLSGKAAGTILRRVLALFDLEILGDIVPFPSPQAFLLMDDEAKRGAGLSWNKIKAINDLSQKKIDGIIPDNEEISHLPDDEIVERLVSVRGIGRWTVQMYLIFTLGREDIWPVDDLGVQKGFQHAYGLDALPKPKELAVLADHLKPFRSYAAWYCWRVCDELKPQKPSKAVGQTKKPQKPSKDPTEPPKEKKKRVTG